MSELARKLLAGSNRSMSEDEVQFGFNPIDELRRTVNTRSFTPEQAAENRQRSLWEALSVIPGPGNVISAQDAYTGAGDAYDAFQQGDYKGGALSSALAGLSGAGAVLGLPFGKFAKGAADAGKDSLYAIPAWHGSPHDFDEFKLDKIGTGEGAQAYGHGLYFAESPQVAQVYRDTLGDVTINGDAADSTSRMFAVNKIKGSLDDREKVLRAQLDELNAAPADRPGRDLMLMKTQEQLDTINHVRNADVKSTGRLYRTELDVEPEDLLDWDLPLSQQGEIGQKALAVFERMGIAQDGRFKPDTLAGIKDLATQKYGRDSFAASSRALREAGVPGIRYLDQGSRGAGEGSRNFVIFDDRLVKILGKE